MPFSATSETCRASSSRTGTGPDGFRLLRVGRYTLADAA